MSVPLALDPKRTTTARFTSTVSTGYEVLVSMERSIPFEELQTIKPPEVEWSVTVDGRKVGRPASGQWWGERVGFVVGRFDAAEGQQFTIRARIVQPVAGLKRLNPHLQVQVAREDQKRLLWLTGGKRLDLRSRALLATLVGVGCFAGVIYQAVRSRQARRVG